MQALEQAIKRKRGVTPLARALGTSPQNVTNWRKRGHMPVKFHCAVHRIARMRTKCPVCGRAVVPAH